MFGGEPHSAPPENGFVFEGIIQPGVAIEFRRSILIQTRILQYPDEGERARDVVVRDDQRFPQVLMDVAVDHAPFLDERGFGPTFERAAHIDADHFSKNPGVDAVFVVLHVQPFSIPRESRNGTEDFTTDQRKARNLGSRTRAGAPITAAVGLYPIAMSPPLAHCFYGE